MRRRFLGRGHGIRGHWIRGHGVTTGDARCLFAPIDIWFQFIILLNPSTDAGVVSFRFSHSASDGRCRTPDLVPIVVNRDRRALRRFDEK